MIDQVGSGGLLGHLQPVDPACRQSVRRAHRLIVLTQLPSPLQAVGIALVVIAGAAAQRGDRRPTDQVREEVVL
ncbi:hypothetical protein [Gordonia alkaliphila]|uniref:hypothetical protein n=1 Tax=Gordonia alkaliphila TaxID=1053547 RepID=UPI0031EEC1DA